MKKISLVLIIAVLTMVMAACSSGGNSGTEGSKGTNGGANAGEKQGEGGGEEAVTLKIVYKDEGTANPVSVKFFQQLEEGLKKDEGLNVKFELVDVAQGSYAENLNLLLLSGTIPDIIYFQGGDQQMSQQGLLEDLRPYIEQSTYLKDIIQPHNETRLESYPYLLWIKPLAPKAPVIRSDWFQQLESSKALADDPTIDNYYAFFKELVEKKPGGDKPSYAITAAGNMDEINFIFNAAFGLDKTWLKKDDGTYEFGKVSENEKEKLAFYNKLYNEGLLDPQYITKQWDTKEDAFYKGEAGVITGTAGKVVDLYDGRMMELNGNEAALTVLPPAKGVSQGFGATDVTKESRGLAISSQSKHKDAAFKVFDYLASPNGQKLDRLGFENEHYAMEDGQIALNDKYYGEWYARFWEPIDFKSDTPLKTPLLGGPAMQTLELAAAYYTPDNNFIIPEQYVANWDAMNNLYKEYSTDFITGKRSLNEFDKFVDAWHAAGGTELTKYANENIK
ncbi:extracellular solute-binding protein [Paenibacillus sp. J5C_2022]|uniref:extracellular solute-binding protein n=1 Tax=Paenibacillus sp. J5C2022 TaxID=2977129 RepID=UPI0021D0501E|nr:extracellular solute-binding protein [Paenibacillus sp. J5C2022]MCU6711614.1 extracellular solute-binding protein [Paenibacillus sp. J5C2022]